MLSRGNNSHKTMLITVNTKALHAEAATVASDLPCRQSLVERHRPGRVLALAGRCAR
jgi:hypothetical protein